MVSAIVAAVGSIFGGAVKLAEDGKEKKYGRLNQWLSARDFKGVNNSSNVIIVAVILLVITVIVVVISKVK
jgi:hypothetical protein